jgi:hypothetical protein
VQNPSPYLSPPRINNLNNNTKSLIPDDFFSLINKLIDEPEQQNDEEVIPPEIIIRKKRRRPIRSRNKVYKPVLDDQKHSTRSKSKHIGFAMPGIAKAFAIDKLDNEFTNPKNQYRTYNFSFNNSYKDSDGDKDPDYVDENINNNKLTFYYIFNISA